MTSRSRARSVPTALQRSEHDEQVALFQWAAIFSGQVAELTLLFAVPNGGQRHKAVAAKLKAEGVKSGVPDVMLPVARGGYHGLFVEMKRANGVPSDVSDLQAQWHHTLRYRDYQVVVAFGFDQARAAILKYLSQSPSSLP